MKVKDISVRKILNSVGDYSIEVKIKTKSGEFKASTPQGTSKGSHEVKEYAGGINTSIKNINRKIKPIIKKSVFSNVKDILAFEEKTKKFGGNVVIAISYSLLKALANEKKVPVWKLFTKTKKMPALLNLMIAGGVHAGKQSPTFQEFLVLRKFKDLNKNLELHKEIGKDWGFWGKDLEGGWVINASHERAFKIIRDYDKNSRIGTDVAASEFYRDGKYVYRKLSLIRKNEKIMPPKKIKDRTEQIMHIKELREKYNIYIIEDPLQEDDFKGFAELTKSFGKNTLIVGDDLFVTNPERLKKGIKLGACNACIVKPDQVGSLSKTIEFVNLAKKNSYTPIISHRSGETNETILADLAVGLQIPIMKIGISGGERVSKINRLFEIVGE
jgi:enolase